MTIREHIRRQLWKIALTLGVALGTFEVLAHHKNRLQRVLVLASAVQAGSVAGFVHWPLAQAITVDVLLLIVVFSTAVVIVRRTWCPRCQSRLKGAVRAGGSDKPTINNCPNCGVSFNDPMPASSVR